jgi:hypothetical protein
MENKIHVPNHQPVIITVYLENHKDKIVCPYAFGHSFGRYVFFSKHGHVRLQSLYEIGQWFS